MFYECSLAARVVVRCGLAVKQGAFDNVFNGQQTGGSNRHVAAVDMLLGLCVVIG